MNWQLMATGVAVALLVALPPSIEAQGSNNGQCADGKRAPFRIAEVGSRGEVRPIEILPCAPPSPDFVAEDSKQLLSKIKLAKAQGDSSKKLTSAFAARQNAIGATRMKAISEEQAKSAGDSKPISKSEARRLYLTPEMQGLRDQFALSLRALLTPEQVKQYETNVAALKAKDEKISG